MATVSLKILGVCLFAGASPLLADEAGKAAAKAYAHASSKSAAAISATSPAAKEIAAARAQEAAPGPGRMQVEEPSEAAVPGANTSKAWQNSHRKGLTDTQKAAFRERKEKMEGMIALIKAKREALRDAKPEERAAIARELHILILEKEGSPATVTAAARLEDKAASEAEVGARKSAESQVAAEAQAQRREEVRERQAERRKERKAKENRD
jgi:hypothetical protein